MSGGKPVLMSVMYSPKARIRWGSDHRLASCSREETSFSKRSPSLDRAGQVRNGLLESFRFSSAAGAGGFWVLIEPGGVGGKVTFCRSHLLDPPCHKLS